MAACFCGNATISDCQVFWIEEVANLRGSLPGLPVAATLYELQRRAQMERLLYAAWPRATSFSAKTTADTVRTGGVAAQTLLVGVITHLEAAELGTERRCEPVLTLKSMKRFPFEKRFKKSGNNSKKPF